MITRSPFGDETGFNAACRLQSGLFYIPVAQEAKSCLIPSALRLVSSLVNGQKHVHLFTPRLRASTIRSSQCERPQFENTKGGVGMGPWHHLGRVYAAEMYAEMYSHVSDAVFSTATAA